VGEPEGFHSLFRSLFPAVDFVEPGNIEQLKALLQKNPDSYAAFIFEPLVQGAGGMRMHQPEFLRSAVELCQAEGILSIADEVFTGFFRTGSCFAFEQANIQPDLLCLSKGITGGFLPLAVTLAQDRVFAAFLSREMKHAFLHGHSYTANPIACAAAVESWKVLHTQESRDQIVAIEKQTRYHTERLKSHPGVRTTRSLGTIGVVELAQPMSYFSARPGRYFQMALERNVLLRPLGNVFYSVPPYCCTEQEIDRIYQVIEELASS
jgi:adenosylmethionine-8-amino-7-oxononanoate aminotransferase